MACGLLRVLKRYGPPSLVPVPPCRQHKPVSPHEENQAERSKSVAEIERLQQDMVVPFEQLIDAAESLLLCEKGRDLLRSTLAVSGWIEQIGAEAPQAFETTNTGLEWHIAAV